MSTLKAEEVVPIILYELSRGNTVSLSSFSESYRVPKPTLKRRFNEIVSRYYIDDIYYDTKDKLWKAKEINFLESSPVQPEEATIFNGILRNSDHFGEKLSKKVHMIVNRYIKRGYLASLRTETVEDLDQMKEVFISLENAMRNRRIVNLHYVKNGENKFKKFLPLRIINLEYYWYVVGEIDVEGEKEIRHFRMKRITNIEPLDEYVDRTTFKSLYIKVRNTDKGMNAFYKPHNPVKKVRVIIPEWFEEHIQDIPYFSTWEKTNGFTDIEGIRYYTYEIQSTDEEYRDIIPTIQKYLPDIIVCDIERNREVIELMRQRSEKYANIFAVSGQ